jgi:hypothetical protein
MTVGQSSASELVYTSIEKQIEAARIRACEWGADAIVIAQSQGGKGNTWSAWSGLTYRDERESRVVAIRYVEPAAAEPAPPGATEVASAAETDTALSPEDVAVASGVVAVAWPSE